MFTTEVKTINALALMRQLPNTASSLKKKYQKRIKELIQAVAWGAKVGPVNYLHHHLFLKGYEAQINKNYTEAITQFSKAINNAKNGDFYLWIALGYELIGELFIEMDQRDYVIYNFRNARYYYGRYGMLTKVQSLEKQYPECGTEEKSLLLSPQTESITMPTSASGATTFMTLDFTSLIKATQAISGEIILDKLCEKMLYILMENAGADKVLILEKDKISWMVTAKLAKTNNEEKFNMLNVPFNSVKNLPHTIIQFSIRSGETVVLENSSESNQYKNDPYILHEKPKSILCLPVIYKNKVSSIIYFENNLTTGAFSEDRIAILNALASQIAISLENARLYYHATHDILTGLANRNLLYQAFELSAEEAKMTTHHSIAIMLFDLDYFKTINDTLGHLIGDKVLVYIANLIATCIGKENLAARLGGDEFVAMVIYQDIKQVTLIAEKFLQKLKEPVKFDNHELTLSSSIGISLYPRDGETIPELLKQADIALYRVKAKGKNQFQLYTT